MTKAIVIATLISLVIVTFFYIQNTKRINAFDQWKIKFGAPYQAE